MSDAASALAALKAQAAAEGSAPSNPGKVQLTGNPSLGNDDWKLWQPNGAPAGGAPEQGVGSYLKQVGTGALGVVKGAADLLGSAYDPSQSMQAGMDIARPQVEQAQKAKRSFNQGDYSEAFGHGLAAALPGVGPAAANIGEKLGNQDYTGAAADATVLGGTMALPHAGGAAAGAIGDAFRLDPEVAAERAWRPSPADSEFPQSTPKAGSDVKTYGNPGVRNNADTIPAANNAIALLQQGMEAYLQRAERAGVQIPGDVLVQATQRAIPDLLWTQDPATAQGLIASADRAFGGRYFDVGRWRDWLRTENASLKKFYSQAGAGQSSAGIAGTPPAIEAAQAQAMRDALYQYLSPEDSGAGPRQIQSRTGDVIALRNNADRASNRVTGERALTPAEGFGKAATGAARIAGAPFQNADIPSAYRQMTNPIIGPTDSLIGRFYDALPPADPIPQPAGQHHPFMAQRQLTSGAPQMGGGPDASYVRSAPAMTQPPNPARALPAGPDIRVTPPPGDTSYVRSVPVKQPLRLPAPPTGDSIATQIGKSIWQSLGGPGVK